MPRWSVVATVSEPAALVVAFAAHHLKLGAAHVYLYLDTPAPDLHALIGDDPRVTLIDAGRRFYRRVLERRYIAGINKRQVVNANHAQTLCDAEWLFHLDADEFLACDPVPELQSVPEDILALRIQNHERLFVAGQPQAQIFDGAIALPIKHARTLERFRGPELVDYSRWGYLGHISGKGACKVGRRVTLGIHRARIKPHFSVHAQELTVHHFDGLSRLHWALKLQRHARNGLMAEPDTRAFTCRDRQIQFAAEAHGDLEAIFDLHDRLRVISPRRARRLEKRGLLIPVGFDPAAAIRTEFPGLSVDLSTASFDRALAAHFAQQDVLPAREAV